MIFFLSLLSPLPFSHVLLLPLSGTDAHDLSVRLSWECALTAEVPLTPIPILIPPYPGYKVVRAGWFRTCYLHTLHVSDTQVGVKQNVSY